MNNKFSWIKLLDIPIYFLLAVVLALLQTTLFVRLPVYNGLPDILFGAVCCIGICRGQLYGAAFGLFAALCVDGLGSTGISLLPLFYTLIGCVCGNIGSNTREGKYFSAYLVTLPLLCLTRTALSFILNIITYFGSIDWTDLLLKTVLPEYLYTLALCIPVFFAVKLFELPLTLIKRNGGGF